MTGPTIHDVAAAAEVSVATVSRVLNGRDDVAPATRERTLATISALRYRPNSTARNLRTRATSVLGLIISDITNPFFTALARGVEDVAQGAGYSVVLANADEDLVKESRYLEVALAEQMAGVVLSPAATTSSQITGLTARGVPVVTIDRRLRRAAVDSVTVNNARAARAATAHLIEQGCRRVGLVGGLATTSSGAGRQSGYRAALRAAGIPLDGALMTDGGFRTEGGYRATHGLLSAGLALDGLFVANNLMTLGALTALHERGVDIPGEVALVGFDDVPWALGLRPQLSVVAQPTYEIGACAAQLLLARIKGDDGPAHHVVMKAPLVVRQSSRRGGSGPP